eukprot:6887839-Pyramimonas_sp.AAC.1
MARCSSPSSDGRLLTSLRMARSAPSLVSGRSICAASLRQMAIALHPVDARLALRSLGGDGAVAEVLASQGRCPRP